MERVLPSLAVVPNSVEDYDLGRLAMLPPGTDDSIEEERYLDFLSLHVELVEETVGRGDVGAGESSERIDQCLARLRRRETARSSSAMTLSIS